jgi:hypothetical protein
MSPSTPPSGDAEIAPKRSSERPPSMPPLPRDADLDFYASMRGAGLLSELTDSLAETLIELVGSKDEDARRLDLIELYYAAAGDVEASRRRSKADRMIVHHAGFGENAVTFIARLSVSNPELPGLRAERMGTDDGPLVLCSGDFVSAVSDDDDPSDGMVAVRSIVQAFNVLLDRVDVHERLVLLRGDGEREVYVAVGATEAFALCHTAVLEEDDWTRLHESCGW